MKAHARGVLITAALEGGPADLGGLLPGDIIHELNGKPVKSAHEIMSDIASTPPGKTLKLGILRGKKRLTIILTVIEKPQNANT